MEARLHLDMHMGMIGSATDFTFKWCVNMGMDKQEAARMTLALDEILTNIYLFGYREKSGEAEVIFVYHASEIEIIVREYGEPFHFRQYKYSKSAALSEGNFQGAGLELLHNLTDHFIYLNRGKDGKEFRLVKTLQREHISDIISRRSDQTEETIDTKTDYLVTPVTTSDAEDVAKLIYKSYNYTYNKEEMYFPKLQETALQQGYKFGTIVRTSQGGPVGYFAVIRNTDSLVGEIGEAVVAPEHRKRGLMKRMINELIDMSKERGLLGLYGFALTVHIVSQIVNQKFNFKNTAILLSNLYGASFKGFDEHYPQPVSVIADFLPLYSRRTNTVYLPGTYESILKEIYSQFEASPAINKLPENIDKPFEETELKLNISYSGNTATIVCYQYGKTFENSCASILKSLSGLKLNAVYIDLPLDHPWIDNAVNWISGQGFIFSGLMPLIHNEKDFFRMQKIQTTLDFNLIHTKPEMATKLKNIVSKEYHELQENKE
jgi:anti-sigma regulatory factor (Ser/Thr protein kinase)/RimJ/RimL family protein N-acetyltransferase